MKYFSITSESKKVSVSVASDGLVRIWDTVANHYTLIGVSEELERQARLVASELPEHYNEDSEQNENGPVDCDYVYKKVLELEELRKKLGKL